MDKFITITLSIAGFLNAISIIITFILRVKKPIDDNTDKKIQKAMEPLNEKMDSVDYSIKKIDKNQCMNYLVNFIEDSRNGIIKDDIQKKRASEVYDHYTKELNGNSYIHDGWEKYVKGIMI